MAPRPRGLTPRQSRARPEATRRRQWSDAAITFADTETTRTQGELAHREEFAHALLTYSCTALGVLGLLTVYNDSLSLVGSLWLSGGCLVAFAAGTAFALAARELGTRQARTVATVAAVVNTLLLLVAGVTLVAL